MSSFSGNGLLLLGAVLVCLAVGGFAFPVVTTQQTRDVAKIGDVEIQTTEGSSSIIPPLLSGGVLFLGVTLIGVGFYQRR